MKYCEEYAALLDAYADGECSPEEAARAEEHLCTCPGCRAYLDEIRLMGDLFPDPEDTAVPDGFADGVMANLRANTAPRSHPVRRWAKVLVPLAACLVLAVALRTGLPSMQNSTASDAAAGAREFSAFSDTSAAAENTEEACLSGSAEDEASSKNNSTALTSGASPTQNAQTFSDSKNADTSGSTAPTSGGSSGASGGTGDSTGNPAALGTTGNFAESFRKSATLTAAQAGTALDGYESEAGVDESTGAPARIYTLSVEEFDAVMQTLGTQSAVAENPDAESELCRLTVLS